MITEVKRFEIIRLHGQLKNLRKTAVKAGVSKDTVIRVIKNRNRKTGKKTGLPETLSVRDNKRVRMTARQLIRQDELVASRIIKNKTSTTASRRSVCLSVS